MTDAFLNAYQRMRISGLSEGWAAKIAQEQVQAAVAPKLIQQMMAAAPQMPQAGLHNLPMIRFMQ